MNLKFPENIVSPSQRPTRLAPINEIALRVYFAKKAGLPLDEVMTPVKLKIQFNRALKAKAA